MILNIIKTGGSVPSIWDTWKQDYRKSNDGNDVKSS